MSGTRQFPRLAASACVWRNGLVLLAQRAKPPAGVWALPGGRVEAGETAVEAAHRELLEETGMTAKLETLVGLYDIIRRDDQGLVIMHYAIACYGGCADDGEPRAGSDALAVQWVHPAKLGGIRLAPHVRDAIHRAIELLKLR